MIAKGKIFIIDDDPVYRLVTKKMLEKSGLFSHIEYFVNGSLGMNALKAIINSDNNYLPANIFLDIEMPVMNGWDFMEEFVKIPAQQRDGINIYIVSSSIADDDRQRAKSYCEIKNYLPKPLTNDIIKFIAEPTFK